MLHRQAARKLENVEADLGAAKVVLRVAPRQVAVAEEALDVRGDWWRECGNEGDQAAEAVRDEQVVLQKRRKAAQGVSARGAAVRIARVDGAEHSWLKVWLWENLHGCTCV